MLIAPVRSLQYTTTMKRKSATDAGRPNKNAKRAKLAKKTKPTPKVPTMKQKQRREGKVVKMLDLKWKPVEIPDGLGDYEGFMGMEELEGVTVRYVNGKPELVQKSTDGGDEENDYDDDDDDNDDATLKPTKTKGDKKLDKPTKQKTKKEVTKSADVEVDTEADDVMESALEAEESGDDDLEVDNDDNATKTKKDDDDEELTPGAFAQADLPQDVNLPEWDEMDLSGYVKDGLSKLGFTKPTEIQKLTIPTAMEGVDVIGKATTGSGKTLAYGIPILERYLARETPDDAPAAIVFAPTRELAHQVVKHLEQLSKYSPLGQHGIVPITGGLSIQKQQRLIKHNPAVIVATPGRLLEHLTGNTELANRWSRTDMVVLDEADRLLQDGHFEEFDQIIEIFRRQKTKKWQTLVFSATFARDLFMKLDRKGKLHSAAVGSVMANDEVVELLQKRLSFRKKPQFIDANPKEFVALLVTEALVECGATERDLYLYYFLLMYPGTSLVFANSIDSVKRLAPFLKNLGMSAFAIHSNMEQKQRLRALERFQADIKLGKLAVLVATDVAARGLDIPNIDHVVHYHIPKSADVYIHRLGRTARAGKEGVALTLCSPEEALGPLRKLRRVVAALGQALAKRIAGDVKLLPIEYDIVGQITPRVKIAAQLADSEILTVATVKEGLWVKQVADDLGLDDLDELKAFEDDILRKQRRRKERKMLDKNEAKAKRAQLRELLAVPLRKNVRRSYLTLGLENMAHSMVHGTHHAQVLGHKQTEALQDLKK